MDTQTVNNVPKGPEPSGHHKVQLDRALGAIYEEVGKKYGKSDVVVFSVDKQRLQQSIPEIMRDKDIYDKALENAERLVTNFRCSDRGKFLNATREIVEDQKARAIERAEDFKVEYLDLSMMGFVELTQENKKDFIRTLDYGLGVAGPRMVYFRMRRDGSLVSGSTSIETCQSREEIFKEALMDGTLKELYQCICRNNRGKYLSFIVDGDKVFAAIESLTYDKIKAFNSKDRYVFLKK